MLMADAQTVFSEAVEESFRIHLSGLGLSLEKVDNRMFVAQSRHCRISVVLDYGVIYMGIKPSFPNSDTEYEEVSLHSVLEALAPELGYRAREFRRPEVIPAEVDRQLRLLVEYCAPIIRGETSAWAKVQDFLEKRRMAPREEVPWQNHDEHIAWLRKKALEAYHQGDFVSVITSYSIIIGEGETLRPDEQRMYNEARRWDEGCWLDQ